MKAFFPHAVWLILFTFVVCLPVAAQKSKKREETNERNAKNLAEAEHYFTEGMKFYITDDYAKSIAFFERSLQISSENSGANYMMADVLVKTGDYAKALTYAEKALRLDDTNKYYYLLLAQLYEKEKKYSQAVKVYQDLIKKRPQEGGYYFELAKIYIYQNKYEDAIKAYDKVEKTYGINEEIIRQKQQIYLKQNKLEEAVREGERLIQEQPGEAGPKIALAELLLSNNRVEKAVPLLEEIVASNPENAQAHLVLSDVYRSRGDAKKSDRELELAFANPELDADTKVSILASYMSHLTDDESKEKALKLVETVAKLHPVNAKVYAVYGELLMMKNEKLQARNMYAMASRIDRSVFEVWERVIQLDGELNQLDSLLLHSEQALEVFPNQATLYYFNGIGHLNKKDYKKATAVLEEGQTLAISNIDLLNEFNVLLGDAYNGLGNNKLSDRAYEEVLKSEPDNVHVLNNYSYYLSLRKENLSKAREMAKRLVDKNPEEPTYLDTYAWVLFVSKEYEEANKYLEKAVKISLDKNKENGTIVEHYGDVLYKLGQTEKALLQWKKAKKLGETSLLLDKKITTGKLYEQ
ncbi:MAG: tetratricopeptide repeat protein [Bacteroidota bacterium]